jgi:anthranilate phosphoribosyltransferase
VLAGDKGPRRDVVVLNAGASLFVGGKAASVLEGIERAAQAIDSGRRGADSRRRWSRPPTRV